MSAKMDARGRPGPIRPGAGDVEDSAWNALLRVAQTAIRRRRRRDSFCILLSPAAGIASQLCSAAKKSARSSRLSRGRCGWSWPFSRGPGCEMQECLELRVTDLKFDRHEIVVRRGKGQKDRRTMLPVAIEERLKGYLREVKRQHEEDLADGFGRVVLLAKRPGHNGLLDFRGLWSKTAREAACDGCELAVHSVRS